MSYTACHELQSTSLLHQSLEEEDAFGVCEEKDQGIKSPTSLGKSPHPSSRVAA